MMALKLVNDMLIRVDFIDQFMKDNQDSTFVMVNTLLFGGFDPKLAG